MLQVLAPLEKLEGKGKGEPVPTAPTCRFVEVLVVYYDAFAHLLKIHAILICRLLLLGGLVGFPRVIFLLHTGETESQSGAMGEAWT